ncbi:SBBP repeat-containing protein [Candidatus Amarolinea dominans]|uniref:SBBP repeat-containing protein n=1 Tax=Candidatus Amarolinea dominans TaxID=3140696 RepID=UPI0031CC9A18
MEFASDGGQMVQRLVARPGADLSAVRLRVEGANAAAVDGAALHLGTSADDVVLPLLEADSLPVADSQVRPRSAQAFDVAAPFIVTDTDPQSEIANPQSAFDNPADLLHGTFLGGSGSDSGYSLAVDGSRTVYVAGEATSADFPTTPGAFDRSYGDINAFVVKLNPSGSALVYATFLGGSSGDDASSASSIAVDESGAAYVTGWTYCFGFPTTPGAF